MCATAVWCGQLPAHEAAEEHWVWLLRIVYAVQHALPLLTDFQSHAQYAVQRLSAGQQREYAIDDRSRQRLLCWSDCAWTAGELEAFLAVGRQSLTVTVLLGHPGDEPEPGINRTRRIAAWLAALFKRIIDAVAVF